jgi:hypothetical protein
MSKKNSSIVFIDWDDTLFPTTWVNKNQINIKNIKNYKIFIKLDEYIFMLLSKIKKKCNIIIITNALKKWIENCISLLPQTKGLICTHNFNSNNNCKNKINVISARENYQHIYGSPIDWKIHTFKKIISKYEKIKKIKKIISIGDSIAEYIALVKLYKPDKKCTFKTIKFIDPSIYIHEKSYKFIFDQIKVIFNNFENIESDNANKDLLFILNN